MTQALKLQSASSSSINMPKKPEGEHLGHQQATGKRPVEVAKKR
jgi:hypothetical protein